MRSVVLLTGAFEMGDPILWTRLFDGPLEQLWGRHADWPPARFGISIKHFSHFSSTALIEGARKTSVCKRSQPSVTHSIAVFSQSLRHGHVLITCV